MSSLSAHDVRNLIIDRLSSGLYPLGSKLPPARELASEVGAHRNTVAKAYQSLADLGLVTLKQGRGTYVAALISEEFRLTMSAQLSQAIGDVVLKARRIGFAENELRRSIDDQIESIYRARPRQAVFVECNADDLDAAIIEIEAMTGFQLTPLLLTDVKQRLANPKSAPDLIFTSLFHFKEVSDLVASMRPELRVIGVYTQPDEDALSEIAQIKPGSLVGIVCSTVEGSHRFANQIATFTTVKTTALINPADDEIRRLADDVDVIVCSRSRTAQVDSLALAVPTILLPFHISPQAVGRIVEAFVAINGVSEDDNGTRQGGEA